MHLKTKKHEFNYDKTKQPLIVFLMVYNFLGLKNIIYYNIL